MKIKLISIFYVSFLLFLITLNNLGKLGIVGAILYGIPYLDKLAHFIVIGLLTFLININFKCATITIWNWNCFKGSVIIIGFVTLEEISQLLIHTRTFEFMDLFANYLGIFVFGRLALYFQTSIKADKFSFFER